MKNKSFAKMITALFLIGFLFLSGNAFAGTSNMVINEIYATGNDDWIEIYNSTDEDIDLFANNIRIYKAVSAAPSLVMRIGNNSDGIYPGGTIIPSHGFYFIVRDNATEELKSKADAIGTKSAFTWRGMSYTIYLGNDAISGDEDENILDRVGFGDAKYYDIFPAVAIENNKSIQRINFRDTDDNSSDFEILDEPTPRNSFWVEVDDEDNDNEDEGGEESDPKTYSNKIRINELLPNPKGKDQDGEFIELYNYGDEEINLTGWVLRDEKKAYKLSGVTINAYGYSVIDYKDSKIILNNTGDKIELLNPQDDNPVDYVSYENSQENYSYSFDEQEWQWTPFVTPGEENKFPEKKIYSDKIYLNEILPNPSGDEKTEEFIEIYNPNKNKIDLTGWILKDSSKRGKYIFPDNTVINKKEFLVVYRSKFKFALNNSGKESVYLLDPNGKTIASINYSKAKEAVSYNFDGKKWRWSKYLTPGKKNKFNNLPAIEIKVDKKAYKNVYVNFEVKVNDPDKDKVKVTWNFGDDRKSYKKKTRHKYKKTGKYRASVKIFDGSEEVFEKFKVIVKKFPNPKVRIISLMPNPSGKDSETEWIRVKNKSKKKVNLKNWSIATGRNSKKMVNHPIYEDLIIKSGKEVTITRKLSKFSLNNKKSRIELRYPNGKVSHKVKYKREDNIGENEVYEKVKNEGWKWVEGIKTRDNRNIQIEEIESERNNKKEEDVLSEEFIGKQSEHESKNRIVLAAYNANEKLYGNMINNQGKVLGVSAVKINNAAYIFTGNINYHEKDHYAVKFTKEILRSINAFLNKIFRFASVIIKI